MKTPRELAFTPVLWAMLLAGVLFGLVFLVGIGGSRIGQSGPFAYGTRNLIGATAQEVGQFAQQYAENNLNVSGGTPQVVLTRAVKRPDLAILGIACLPPSSTIEDPPLMLVILKGQFGFSTMPQSQSVMGISAYKYVAYVFDTWSAQPTLLLGSRDGGQFRLALNDSTLPRGGPSTPLVCPTEAPHTTTLHYGDIPPTPSLPPLPPTPNPLVTIVLPTVPPPVPTGMTK